jgi:hypothetical protein
MTLIDVIGTGGIIPGPLRYTAPQAPAPPTSGGTPSECDGLYYANRSDIELIFGAQNVSVWADLDSDQDTVKIGARVCWALKNVTAEMNDKLYNGPYRVPFIKTSTVPYPTQIVNTCARMAGLSLYEARGITDFAENGIPKNQLFSHAQMIKMFFYKILNGQMRLIGQVSTQNVPGVYTDQPVSTSPFTKFTF